MMERKWTVVIAVVVLLCFIPLAVGAVLPASHTASRSQHFHESPDQLWPKVLHEYNRENDGSYKIVRSQQPQELVTEAHRPGMFGGTWTYTLRPVNEGTDLTIVEHADVYNPVFRFLERFVFGYEGSMDKFLANVK